MLGDVHMPSTIYKPSTIPKSQLDHITTEPIMKVIRIKEYNEKIRALNKSDIQISFSKRVKALQNVINDVFSICYM